MNAAKTLAQKMLRYFDWPAERYDLVAFGLAYLLLYLTDVAGVLLAGWVSGAFACTIAAALTAAVFRTFTGGAHFSRAWLCWFFSYTVLGLFGGLAKAVTSPAGPVFIASFLAAAGLTMAAAIPTLAPVASPAKKISPAHAVRLRRGAWVTLLLWAGISTYLVWRGHLGVAVASGLGLTWQTFTLTPGGAWLYRQIDRVLAAGHEAGTEGGASR